MSKDKIVIKGARVHNLKNIDLTIPRNKLVIMTGLSGSGKTSLAFDTMYAEGQRRYVESLSAYARQFLDNMEKPDVDYIEGLSPSISIDQKTTHNNPRSTIGTVTEIYDYLRLMYARIGTPYCPIHHTPIVAISINQMVDQVMNLEDEQRIEVYAPVVHQEKGTHKDKFAQYLKEGFIRARVNKQLVMLEEPITLDKNHKHDIDIMIDRLVKREDSRSRLYDSFESATKLSNGLVLVIADKKELLFSQKYACVECGFSIP